MGDCLGRWRVLSGVRSGALRVYGPIHINELVFFFVMVQSDTGLEVHSFPEYCLHLISGK